MCVCVVCVCELCRLSASPCLLRCRVRLLCVPAFRLNTATHTGGRVSTRTGSIGGGGGFFSPSTARMTSCEMAMAGSSTQ